MYFWKLWSTIKGKFFALPVLSREWKTDIGPNKRMLRREALHSWYLHMPLWEMHPSGCSRTKTCSNIQLLLTTSSNSMYLAFTQLCVRARRCPWIWRYHGKEGRALDLEEFKSTMDERTIMDLESLTQNRVWIMCNGGGTLPAQCRHRTPPACSFRSPTSVSLTSWVMRVLDSVEIGDLEPDCCVILGSLFNLSVPQRGLSIHWLYYNSICCRELLWGLNKYLNINYTY